MAKAPKIPKPTRKPAIKAPLTFTIQKQEVFLEKLAETANVTEAAAFAEISRRTIYDHLGKSPEFAEAFEKARQVGIEGLDDVAGYRGREKSDLLLIFKLKGERPDKYRERKDVQVSGELKISRYSVEDLEKVQGEGK